MSNTSQPGASSASMQAQVREGSAAVVALVACVAGSPVCMLLLPLLGGLLRGQQHECVPAAFLLHCRSTGHGLLLRGPPLASGRLKNRWVKDCSSVMQGMPMQTGLGRACCHDAPLAPCVGAA
jgi:hypothetical protein